MCQLRGADVGQRDRRSGAGEGARDRLTDTAAGAGDDDLRCDVIFHGVLLSWTSTAYESVGFDATAPDLTES